MESHNKHFSKATVSIVKHNNHKYVVQAGAKHIKQVKKKVIALNAHSSVTEGIETKGRLNVILVLVAGREKKKTLHL